MSHNYGCEAIDSTLVILGGSYAANSRKKNSFHYVAFYLIVKILKRCEGVGLQITAGELVCGLQYVQALNDVTSLRLCRSITS